MLTRLHGHSISPPHSNLVTLRNLATPLNPADINQIQGTYPTAPPFTTSLGSSQPLATPGNEACFEVISAGSGVKTIQKGDWVIPRATGLGTWRTHLQCEEDKVVRIEKEGLTVKQAATVSVNPVTAWRMLKDFVDLGDGDWFIQNGANSGVGRAAIQFAKMWGLNNIAVIRDKGPEKTKELQKELLTLGATHVVTDQQSTDKGFVDQVKEWTNGGQAPIKLGLNCVGGDSAMAMSKILSPGASLVTYGAMSRASLKVGASMLIFKDLRFVGFWVSRWADQNPEAKLQTVTDILDLVRDKKFTDGPTTDIPWTFKTDATHLIEAVQGTLDGHRDGKGIFVFENT